MLNNVFNVNTVIDVWIHSVNYLWPTAGPKCSGNRDHINHNYYLLLLSYMWPFWPSIENCLHLRQSKLEHFHETGSKTPYKSHSSELTCLTQGAMEWASRSFLASVSETPSFCPICMSEKPALLASRSISLGTVSLKRGIMWVCDKKYKCSCVYFTWLLRKHSAYNVSQQPRDQQL